MPMSPHGRLVLATGAALALMSSTVTASAAPWGASQPVLRGRVAFTANFTGGSGDWQVYTMTAAGTDLRQVTHFKSSKDGVMFPSWSPDGRRLLFSSSAAGTSDIYSINPDGSGQHRITTDPNTDAAPAWSPDGNQIAFARAENGDSFGIWTMHADGTGQRQLAADGFFPIFTRDGRHILYTSQAGGLVSAVWVMDPNGAHQRRLTPAWLEAAPFDVSPDGRRVLVGDHLNTELPTALWSMKLDGTGLHRLTGAGCCYHDGNARYSPDGRSIEFTTDRWFAPLGRHQSEIWAMTADGKHLRAVTSSITVGGCPDDFGGNCNGPISWRR